MDLSNGNRVVITTVGNIIQNITLEDPDNSLVIGRDGGTGNSGELFRVNLSTGMTQLLSDFGDPFEGDLGLNPNDVIIFDAEINTSDLAVVKTSFPNPVIVGEPLTYTAFVINYGPAEATGVTFIDTLPAGVAFVSATAGCVEAAGVVTCDLGTMVTGDIEEISITVTAPGSTGAILNVAEVTSDQEDPVPGDNRTEEITQVVNDPISSGESNLFIFKTDTPDPVVVGTQLSYNLFIANLGPATATGVVVTDILPAGVMFDSAPGCAEAAGVVTCNVGALASGAVASFTINVTPNNVGVIFNIAQVSGDQLDSAPGNNSAGEVTTVVDVPVIVPMADLFVQKTDNPDPVVVGEMLEYTIFVNNFGPDTAENVVITDTLPMNTTFVSAPGCMEAGGIITCDLGDLADGDDAIITVTVTPNMVETIFNIAEVTSDTQDPESFNNVSVESTLVVPEPIVIPKADLNIIKSGTPNPVVVGLTLTYQIVATNQGPDTATGVVITDTLPSTVTFVSADPGCVHAAGVVTCNIGALAAGAFTQINVQVTPNTTGGIVNIAQIDGNEFDPTTSNNISTETTNVINRPIDPPPDPPGGGDQPGSDLFVTKFASPSPAEQGEAIVYTVSIGNLGPLDATGVTLLDVLPAGVSFVSANSSQGSCSEADGIVTCNLGNLPDIGDGIIAVIDIVVVANGTGSIVNTAVASASQDDPNTSNNAATVIVNVEGGSTNPNPTPTPTQTPSDPGAGDTSGDNSNSNCSIGGPTNNKDTAFNLALLMLPLLIIGARAARRKNTVD